MIYMYVRMYRVDMLPVLFLRKAVNWISSVSVYSSTGYGQWQSIEPTDNTHKLTLY